MASPRVLVTGASGFIATHVIKQLQEAGYRVRGTVRSLKNTAKIQPLKELCPDAKYPLDLVEADLTDEGPWAEAVKGCEYVLHTASPFAIQEPKDEEELIKPARDGTLFVLRACAAQAPGVKRVVITSSVAAVHGIFGEESPRKYSEEDWKDITAPGVPAYYKSKYFAEKCGWDFVEKLSPDKKFELAVINPAFVMGPVLCGGAPSSMQFIMMVMTNNVPEELNDIYGYCDVRDVAKAHLQAMIVPAAAGKRHIIYSESMWLKETQKDLAEEFNPQGFDVKINEIPANNKKKATIYDNTRMKTVLGIEPIPAKKSVVDMVKSLVERGILKKSG